MNTVFTYRQYNWLLTTALCGVLLGSQQIALAEVTATLDKIDLISQGNGTTINLYTGSIVPYKQVYRTSDKLIIEFEHVTAPRTIVTNLAKAQNISHVIFQPLNNDKIRMVVKGKNLGQSVIRFKEEPKTESLTSSLSRLNATKQASTKSYIQSANDALDADIADFENEEATVVETSAEPPEPVADIAEPAPPEPRDVSANDIIAASSPSDESSHALLASENTTDSTTQRQVVTADTSFDDLFSDDDADSAVIEEENTDLSETAQGLEGVRPVIPEATVAGAKDLTTQAASVLENILPPIGMDLLKPVVGISLLLIGLGLFIRRRVRHLSRHGGTAPSSQRQSAKLSFQALAEAHRYQQDDLPAKTPARPMTSKPLFDPNDHPKKANKWASKPQPVRSPQKSAGQPVGLGALLSALPQTPVKPSKPSVAATKGQAYSKRQVVNQYQQQATATRETAKPQAAAAKPKTQQSVKSAKQAVQSKMQSIRNQRQQAASNLPKGNANEPIPGNPQVLDFLKNVAEYMERDGNSQRARSIQKNLRNYQ